MDQTLLPFLVTEINLVPVVIVVVEDMVVILVQCQLFNKLISRERRLINSQEAVYLDKSGTHWDLLSVEHHI